MGKKRVYVNFEIEKEEFENHKRFLALREFEWIKFFSYAFEETHAKNIELQPFLRPPTFIEGLEYINIYFEFWLTNSRKEKNLEVKFNLPTQKAFWMSIHTV
jgi:hypothetical protein